MARMVGPKIAEQTRREYVCEVGGVRVGKLQFREREIAAERGDVGREIQPPAAGQVDEIALHEVQGIEVQYRILEEPARLERQRILGEIEKDDAQE